MNNNPTVEINDREYLIRLSKDDFDLKFVSQLLKRLQSEQTFDSQLADEDEINKRIGFNSLFSRFDHLIDK